MAVHRIYPDQDSMYGTVSAEFKPVVTIQSGDSVQYSLFDAGWGTSSSEGQRFKPYERRPEIDLGHALCGPVYINGARKGMTLEVRIDELIPGPYGFTAAGQYPNWQNRMLGLTEYEEIVLEWKLDSVTRVGWTTIKDRAFSVGLRPFLGFLGMPPEESGIHSTWPPRFSGGNIDCKELTVGSRLYLPISVDGAYFFAGDGHATQGDGEISCQAIECPMESARLTFQVHEDMPLTLPIANTDIGWITFGFHEDLNEATVQAMDGMLNLMGRLYGLNRVEAIALGSAVVDLRITQVVNGVKGVHAVLPHHALHSEMS
ncbi:acetamidase/formamidase family protein [Paenibacillus xylaniclasticus]|uniref:acetamidase/formamidase family protein n=1 Tax=Paenibacillus xylaniclasticus TaxID=588083 RepID=UPI000FD89708|nr:MULTISPECIES: acetamidase/formamidase family protein [Paenibacillus]GFN34067.1 acetamidase [Paenibacillus curdlanolyticus]